MEKENIILLQLEYMFVSGKLCFIRVEFVTQYSNNVCKEIYNQI